MFNDSNQVIEDSMLTTEDNPYSPFDEWDEWFAFDTSKGYDTCSYLARVVRSSSELSEIDNNIAISEGILKILELNLTGNYKRVTRKDFELKN
jgi:hypothetical protein